LAVCVTTPEPFFGVGQWYMDFSQITDAEVMHLLQATAGFAPARGQAGGAQPLVEVSLTEAPLSEKPLG
jgi:hypothetical protein